MSDLHHPPMTDLHHPPMTELLTCGHTRTEGGPEPFDPYRVVRFEGDWGVESLGSWCPACVAAGRAPAGGGWYEARDEVARRRAGSGRPTEV